MKVQNRHVLGTVVFPILGLALIVLICIAISREERQEWKVYQRAYLENRAKILASSLKGTLPEAELRSRVEAAGELPLRIKEMRPAITGKIERCLTCHEGIEEISPSHPVDSFGCVICHGGDGLGVTEEIAHRGLIGGRNPSGLAVIDQTCARPGGQCHAGRKLESQNSVDRVRRGVMATMSGVIASLRYSWNAQPAAEAGYASVGVKGPVRSGGEETVLLPIPLMDPVPGGTLKDQMGQPITISGQPADDQWRKFCARCHIWSARKDGPSAHSSGCAACHALYGPKATYEGLDPTLPKDKPGYAHRHQLTTAIPVEQCLRCHNRSGRIGLSFTGLQEADGYGTPYSAGGPNLQQLSGERDARHLVADIHFEKGLACTDCHTGSEIMGDGHIYGHMREQVEIRCIDCHGEPGRPPGTKVLMPRDEEALWKIRALKMPDMVSTEVGITQRGTPLLNLRREGGKTILRSKLDQKDHLCPVISDDKYHRIPGHGPSRMECSACHSRWAPQCYGCHDYRRRGESMTDSMLGTTTDGAWQETRDFYRYEKPALGINSRNRVSVIVPGCQVVYTELDANGNALPGLENKIFTGPGFAHGIVSTPISPHTTRTEVRSCEECHSDPKVMGIGQGLFQAGRTWEENTFTPLLKPGINPGGFAWESLADSRGLPLMSTTHPGARPFNAEELKRILRVAPCLPCHGRYDDPIWTDPGDPFVRAKLPAHQDKVARFLEGRK
ncbi:MAG: hypothetical protein WAN11_00765 [Syntrophobacteraceae bacterium]